MDGKWTTKLLCNMDSVSASPNIEMAVISCYIVQPYQYLYHCLQHDTNRWMDAGNLSVQDKTGSLFLKREKSGGHCMGAWKMCSLFNLSDVVALTMPLINVT